MQQWGLENRPLGMVECLWSIWSWNDSKLHYYVTLGRGYLKGFVRPVLLLENHKPGVASQCESKNTSMSPEAALAPARRAPISPVCLGRTCRWTFMPANLCLRYNGRSLVISVLLLPSSIRTISFSILSGVYWIKLQTVLKQKNKILLKQVSRPRQRT